MRSPDGIIPSGSALTKSLHDPYPAGSLSGIGQEKVSRSDLPSSQASAIASGVNSILDALAGSRDYNNAWSAYQASVQRNWSAGQAQMAREFNSYEAAKNRDWQEMMSNTAHQREVRDLQAAGLNPVLSAMGGNGAAVTSGATASAVMPSGATADTDESANGAIASILATVLGNQQRMFETMINARLTEAMTDKQIAANQYLGELSALTSRHNAETAAGASMYGSQLSSDAVKFSALQSLLGTQYASNNTLLSAMGQRNWESRENEKKRKHDIYMAENYPQTQVGGIKYLAEGVKDMLSDASGKVASGWNWLMKQLDESDIGVILDETARQLGLY